MYFQAHFVRRKCGRGVTLSPDGATASANYFGPGSIGPDGDCRVVVCSNGMRSNDNPELETVRIAWQYQLENSDEIWYAILFFFQKYKEVFTYFVFFSQSGTGGWPERWTRQCMWGAPFLH